MHLWLYDALERLVGDVSVFRLQPLLVAMPCMSTLATPARLLLCSAHPRHSRCYGALLLCVWSPTLTRRAIPRSLLVRIVMLQLSAWQSRLGESLSSTRLVLTMTVKMMSALVNVAVSEWSRCPRPTVTLND